MILSIHVLSNSRYAQNVGMTYKAPSKKTPCKRSFRFLDIFSRLTLA